MGFNKIQDDGDTCPERMVLCETFYINNKKNTVYQVSLSNKGFCLKKCMGGILKEQVIQISDIIGCRYVQNKNKIKTNVRSCACSSPNPNVNKGKNVAEESNVIEAENIDSSAYIYIYAYVLKKNLRSHLRRERTVLTLRFRSFDKYEDNMREAHKWQAVIRQLKNLDQVNSVHSNQRKLLIILNPKSGAGKARQLFHEVVVPIFVEADISYDLYVTKHANYAKEFMRTKNLNNWQGVLVVGGDGIYWEVINGLMQRQDWEDIFHKVAIGIVPCGSGNGLAKSISYSYNEPYEPNPILSAALNAVRGRTALMDLVRVETRTQIMFSFLSIGWGLISDIDIESERLRSIGYQRFTVWSVHRLISLRTYHGKLSYIPKIFGTDLTQANHDSNTFHKRRSSMYTCPAKSETADYSEIDLQNEFDEVISLETSGNHEDFRQRIDSWYSATSRKSTYFSITESLYQSVGGQENGSDRGRYCQNNSQTFGPSPCSPSLMTPVPNTWKSEEGEYVMIHAAYQTHLGIDCFFAPSAKLNDGVIWLVVIRGGVSRSQLLSFLLNMSSGTHIPTKPNEFIQIIPVSAFRIEPTGTEGIITVDGERVEYGSIQGEIFPGLVKVMVP